MIDILFNSLLTQIAASVMYLIAGFVIAANVVAWYERKPSSKRKVLAYPVVAVFYIYDIVLNLTVFTLITLDAPKELTVTRRMRRYKTDYGAGYRLYLARLVCHIANFADPNHC